MKKSVTRVSSATTSHLPGYPWPPEDKYWTARDEYGVFPEDLVSEFVKDFAEVRKVFADSIAPWNPLPLWEDGAPGFREDYGQPQPSIALKVHPDGGERGTVIVCPGGAFLWKASYEGMPVAERFYEEGFNAAVLCYRVAPYTKEYSYMDGQRAVRYLRANAAKLGLKSDKIAMLGFSAGGMMSNATGAIFTYGDPDAEDPVERFSSRLDAVVPCYGAFSHIAWPSDKSLNYNRKIQAHESKMSADGHISADTPPYFIWQCGDMDDPRQAINLGRHLANHGVPFEMHLFPYGAHGTALSDGGSPTEGADDPHVAHWVELCFEWLRNYDF